MFCKALLTSFYLNIFMIKCQKNIIKSEKFIFQYRNGKMMFFITKKNLNTRLI